MVLVTWNQETGELEQIRQGDGPGEYTDDVDAEVVDELLRGVESIDEEVIAGAIMSAYEGCLEKFSCQATVDTFETSPNTDLDTMCNGTTVTTIGFVEVCDEESKLDLVSCDSCNYSPSSNEWIFDIREASDWIYHDWLCPRCDSIAHTELVHIPEDEPLLKESAK